MRPAAPSITTINRQRCFPAFLLSVVVCFHSFGLGQCNSSSLIEHNHQSSSACNDFTSDHGSEFFSPNYPRLYPNNTACYRTIMAPFGYVIRLEFREQFSVEPSPNCEYDFLEIRDGNQGYAKLVGKYCGNSFPAEVTSTDRYLWLRFSSDDTIEYAGFRVAFKFIKSNAFDRPDLQSCYFHISGVAGKFGTDMISEERYNYTLAYGVPLHCLWEIEVQQGWEIYLTIPIYALGVPNECDLNFIDIFYDSLESANIQAHYCGSVTEPKWSKGNKMHILYYEDTKALKQMEKRGTFEVLYTAFRSTTKDEKCDKETEFDCEDSTCIDKSLRCNDNANCKYKTDEENCKLTQVNIWDTIRMKIILVVGVALLVSIMVPSCLKFYRKIKNNGDDEEEESGGSVAGGEPLSVRGSLGQRTIEGSLHEVGVNGKGITNVGRDDDDGCYVPEVDLSIFLKRSNGGHSICTQDSPPISGDETPLDSTLPNNFDSADPLITTTPTNGAPPFLAHVAPLVPQILHKKANNYYRTSPRTSTPPPPPPPSYFNGLSMDSSCYTPDQDTNNLLFMPPPPTMEEVEESDAIFGLPSMSIGIPNGNPPRSKFKAEATIEADNRQRSFESTKSAPDVIGRI